jgi:hypothetical protein
MKVSLISKDSSATHGLAIHAATMQWSNGATCGKTLQKFASIARRAVASVNGYLQTSAVKQVAVRRHHQDRCVDHVPKDPITSTSKFQGTTSTVKHIVVLKVVQRVLLLSTKGDQLQQGQWQVAVMTLSAFR